MLEFPVRCHLLRCLVSRRIGFHFQILAALLATSALCAAQSKPQSAAPDVLVLANGDTLHGKFVNAMEDKVTFHTEDLGDVSVGWDKIKELHTSQKFAVLSDQHKMHHRREMRKLPEGTIEMSNQAITVHPENAEAHAPIPVKQVEYIMDPATLDKQVNREPGLFSAWNGAATAGATLVAATQNQYTVSGGIGLVRIVPTVSWLDPRNRTSIDFTGSFGKITQPAYTNPGPPPVLVASVVTKSAIYHADAERDQYFSPRMFALVQTAFDHNFAQDLDLQQIYGGGIGWTALKTPQQEADLKATVQYEKQQFITGGSTSKPNLVGSTFSATYALHTKLVEYTQGLSYIAAYNDTRAYSADETNTFAFPAYKNLSFSIGTLDSYLNNPPSTLPPVKRNSFQFTMGLTYAIKSKY